MNKCHYIYFISWIFNIFKINKCIKVIFIIIKKFNFFSFLLFNISFIFKYAKIKKLLGLRILKCLILINYQGIRFSKVCLLIKYTICEYFFKYIINFIYLL